MVYSSKPRCQLWASKPRLGGLARGAAFCASRHCCLGNTEQRPNQRCWAWSSAGTWGDRCANRMRVLADWRWKPAFRTARRSHLGNTARILANGFTRGPRRQHSCQRQWIRTRASADWRVQQLLPPISKTVSVMSRGVQCNALAVGVVRTNLAESCAVGAYALAHERDAPAPETIRSRRIAYVARRADQRFYTWWHRGDRIRQRQRSIPSPSGPSPGIATVDHSTELSWHRPASS